MAPIELTHDPDAGRVEVTADGRPFTTYLSDEVLDVLAKPVLDPIRTAEGTPITRGYPIDPRPGERVDHAHHIGLWLNYGEVNGLDFWNNSGETTEGFGEIRHRSVERIEDGSRGELAVTADWNGPDGRRHLAEETTYGFAADEGSRTIDRTTTLTASDGPVDLEDDKEGMLGLRVRRELEHPAEGTGTLVGEDGEPTEDVPLDDETVVGEYLNEHGVRGTDVWGSRSRWLALSGAVADEPVTVVIMDHPDNVGHPTYWHARGYGLFAANPLGQAVFTDGDEHLGFELDDGESTTFRYRVSVHDDEPSADEIDARYGSFADG